MIHVPHAIVFVQLLVYVCVWLPMFACLFCFPAHSPCHAAPEVKSEVKSEIKSEVKPEKVAKPSKPIEDKPAKSSSAQSEC